MGLPGPLRSFRRGGAAKLPSWHRSLPSQEGGRDKSTPGRSPIFYDGTLNADTYRKWLDDNAISYVALSNGPYDWAATDEATLVRGGLPYLQPCGRIPRGPSMPSRIPRPVISAPGRVIARDPVSLTVTLPEPGEYVCACTGPDTCPSPMAA